MALKIDLADRAEAVRPDSPTGVADESDRPKARRGGQRSKTGAAGSKRQAASSGKETPNAASPTDPVGVALGGPQRPVATRQSGELWELAVERAKELDVPVRALLTDALARSLDLQNEELIIRVKETERRAARSKAERI